MPTIILNIKKNPAKDWVTILLAVFLKRPQADNQIGANLFYHRFFVGSIPLLIILQYQILCIIFFTTNSSFKKN